MRLVATITVAIHLLVNKYVSILMRRIAVQDAVRCCPVTINFEDAAESITRSNVWGKYGTNGQTDTRQTHRRFPLNEASTRQLDIK